ncbi:MAG: hypothetical protein ACSLE8_12535 [Rhodococcus sp. (in: high G+C Gram-positive bacteria)]
MTSHRSFRRSTRRADSWSFPTMSLEYTPTTNATYSQPKHASIFSVNTASSMLRREGARLRAEDLANEANEVDRERRRPQATR